MPEQALVDGDADLGVLDLAAGRAPPKVAFLESRRSLERGGEAQACGSAG